MHGQGNRQKRFARARRPDAKYQIVLLNRFQVTALIRRPRRDLFAPGRIDDFFVGQEFTKRGTAVFGDLFEGIAQFNVSGCFAFGEKLAEVFENAFDDGDISFIAFDEKIAAPSTDTYAQQGFKEFDVLILWPEESF